MEKQGFSKLERIVSQKLIDELFTGGQSHSLTAFPLRAVYIIRDHPSQSLEEENHVSPCKSVAKEENHESSCKSVAKTQLLLSVPKRRFKHAVDRNRVKRQLREGFRKHKTLLAENVEANKCVALAFIWMSDNHLPTSEVEKRVVTILRRIADAMTEKQVKSAT